MHASRVKENIYLTVTHSGTATQFWKRHAPPLSEMDKVYLSVSPGSVPVENLFSTAVYVLNHLSSTVSEI